LLAILLKDFPTNRQQDHGQSARRRRPWRPIRASSEQASSGEARAPNHGKQAVNIINITEKIDIFIINFFQAKKIFLEEKPTIHFIFIFFQAYECLLHRDGHRRRLGNLHFAQGYVSSIPLRKNILWR
jgi:hypothetical protein